MVESFEKEENDEAFDLDSHEVYSYENDDTLNGLCSVKSPDGSLLRRYGLKDGKIDGILEEYDDGTLVRTTSFKLGVLDGPLITYDSEGHVTSNMMYKNGLLEGEGVIYQGGVLFLKISYQKGVQHGPVQSFFPSGKIQSISNYANGKLHGLFKAFTAKGEILRICTYKEGEYEGDLVTYYPGPVPQQVVEVIPYKSNKKDGVARRYTLDGHPALISPYKEDLLEGEEIEYHPHITRDQADIVKRRSLFEKGILKSEKHFDTTGNEVTNSASQEVRSNQDPYAHYDKSAKAG